MAFTTDQIDALDAAIAQGALEVHYGDKKVRYRSLAEMLETRHLMAQALGLTSPANGRRLASFSKGIDC
jgi:hypothetical protein